MSIFILVPYCFNYYNFIVNLEVRKNESFTFVLKSAAGVYLLMLYSRFFIFRFHLFIFLERGKEGEREGRNINMWLPLERPPLGTWPATQACALTGNWTSNPLVCRPALNPLSHTSQGYIQDFKILKTTSDMTPFYLSPFSPFLLLSFSLSFPPSLHFFLPFVLGLTCFSYEFSLIAALFFSDSATSTSRECSSSMST